MKLNTHERTPRPKNSKLITALFVLCFVLVYVMFGLGAFACIYYGKSVIGGLFVIAILVFCTLVICIPFFDMKKAYIEIVDNNIYVVDYYLGIKKEKRFLVSDITSAEVVSGYSNIVKGYRMREAGIQYIIFKNGKEYLFKMICLPETKEIFKKYINN